MANLKYRSGTVDGATAIAHELDTIASYVTTGSKLLSIKNAGTEKFSIRFDGQTVVGGAPSYTPQAGVGFVVNAEIINLGNGTGNIGLELKSGSAGAYISDASLFWLNFEKTAGAGRNQVRFSVDQTFSNYFGIINTSQTDGNAGSGSPGLKVNSLNTLATSGDRLLSLHNNGSEKVYVEYDGTLYLGAVNTPSKLTSREDDGATAIGFILDTANSFVTGGSKLFSIKNAGTEKLTIRYDGAIHQTQVTPLTLISNGDNSTQAHIMDTTDTSFNSGGVWGSWRVNGTEFCSIRANSFQFLGTSNSQFVGPLIINSTGSSIGLTLDGDISFNTNGATLIRGSARMSLIDLFATSEHVINLGDNNSIRIQGKLDGSSNRQFPRIRTLIAPSIDNGAFQIWNETSLPNKNKLLELLNEDGAYSAFSVNCKGGINYKRKAVATSQNTAGESIFGVTDTSIARTVTIDTDDEVSGRSIIVKDESGGAGTNNITITTESGSLIDGVASIPITVNYGVLRLYFNGTNWFSY